MPYEPRGWYTQGLRTANCLVLRDRPMPSAVKERLRMALDDPGWRSDPPVIPDGLPVREVIWLKARALGADGAPIELREGDYAAIEKEIGERARSGLHHLDGHEYAFVRRESGPEWLSTSGDAVELVQNIATLASLLGAQIAIVVNRLRGKRESASSPEPRGHQAEASARPVSEVLLEAHSASGSSVVARYPVDAPPATRDDVEVRFERLAKHLLHERSSRP